MIILLGLRVRHFAGRFGSVEGKDARADTSYARPQLLQAVLRAVILRWLLSRKPSPVRRREGAAAS